MYTDENLIKRENLKESLKLREVLDMFWFVEGVGKEEVSKTTMSDQDSKSSSSSHYGVIQSKEEMVSMEGYIDLNMKLQKALIVDDDFDEEEAYKIAMGDWIEDSIEFNHVINRSSLFSCFFGD